MISTVRGPIDAGELGITLPHEHIFIDLLREVRTDGLLNDPQLMAEELERFRMAGGRTVVDCTNVGLARDPLALRRMAVKTGLNIIMGSGHYREPYIDRAWMDRHSVDEVAGLIVRDIEEGADGTDVRAGIIGEIGCDRYITTAEERSFRAAARAHLRTGVTITTHAARWPVGLPQLELLRSEGVDCRRVIVGHCDLVPSTDYHEAIAAAGAFVQFDTIRGETEYDTERRIGYVLNMVRKGLIRHVLLSHDVCRRSHLAALGGCGYIYLLTSFLPRLREAGLSQEQIEQMTVENPRRALTDGN